MGASAPIYTMSRLCMTTYFVVVAAGVCETFGLRARTEAPDF